MRFAKTALARVVPAFRAVSRFWVFGRLLSLAPVIALVVAGFARRWMDDDGFINLRIARNWLQGYGPVFNLDERVEAATSPLWLLVLTILGAAGVRLEHAAVFGGIVLTAVGLLAAGRGAWHLNEERADRRVLPLPLGAAIYAALPPAWDYASGGLETGLGLAWLGTSYLALSRRIVARSETARGALTWADRGTATLIGVGPLIRPEFAIYGLAMLVPLACAVAGGWSASLRRCAASVGAIATVALAAGTLPLAYLLFRMGYYGAIVPNTALAKEAFLANVNQGRCYFQNFFGTYWMGWPLAAVSPFWAVRLHAYAVARRWLVLALAAALPMAAVFHAGYLVVIGGDYMHGRLLVPALFAALLPVMTVPASAPRIFCVPVVLGASGLTLVVWVGLCAARLRVGVENVCDVGDERGWYARMAKVDNPVELDAYRKHPFYDGALQWMQRVYAECPDLRQLAGSMESLGCRRVFLDEEKARIVPSPKTSMVAGDVDARVGAVVPAGAIGIFGYLFPSNVHVVDIHGLAEPLVARFELESRGRPGHEKKLSAPWLLARFSEPAPNEDLSVTAARHALRCGALRSLETATTAPLTVRVFLENIAAAWELSRLRIPSDPFEAEVRFCRTPRMVSRSTGGQGGGAFRWRCPRGGALSAIRGAFKAEDAAVSFVQPICRGQGSEWTAPGDLVGPPFGETSGAAFEVGCRAGSVALELRGRSDNLVRSVGFLCSDGDGVPPTSAEGAVRGHDFALECPDGAPAIGIEGRSGALLDSIGLLCEPSAGAGGAE